MYIVLASKKLCTQINDNTNIQQYIENYVMRKAHTKIKIVIKALYDNWKSKYMYV